MLYFPLQLTSASALTEKQEILKLRLFTWTLYVASKHDKTYFVTAEPPIIRQKNRLYATNKT